MLPFNMDQPLKVIKKLFTAQLNIGTEGELNCYLCSTSQTGQPARVILAVFISLYEDTSIKLAIPAPDELDNAAEIMDDLVSSLVSAYEASSVHERNQHVLLH